MHSSRRFDIIHCVGSTIALLFAAFVPTPVLTTIVRQPSSAEIDLCVQAGKNCFFVLAAGITGLSGIYLASDTCVPQTESGPYYNAIYHQIVRSLVSTEQRPWGFYEVLCCEHPDHKIKRITLWPKKRLSLQMHEKRSEHWFVISGQAKVTIGKDQIILGPAGSADIPVGAVHRVENVSEEPLVFIEVQQGDYFGEDDIIRFEDDFGRS
ncbi:MAG TPA: cupin domain-containing protein [Deltaproteobacteria bacterium]|nr:cupin domain-containing protein [Deltaproteobacteria bacterium]